ncbi:MAG: GntR family transcriptional regulator [Candidatus Rokubacteria bacterium]|nr:GntR family transcriptional regulator [Candidatus Rokubacteria bacterium]
MAPRKASDIPPPAGLGVNRQSAAPVHVQLKEQLRHLIGTGVLKPGSQLPTVRQLAGYLRINRNTAARALQELHREGYLTTQPGRGTFITDARPPAKGASIVDLDLIVQDALDRARARGFSGEAFLSAVRVQTQMREGRAPARHRLLLVECNQPQLTLFKRQLETDLPAVATPLLIGDLRDRVSRSPKRLKRYRVAVTTIPHVREVKAILARAAIPVVGLLMEASIQALLRLTELPKGTPVGLTCLSREGSQNLLRSVQRAGLTNLNPVVAPADDPQKLRSRLKGVKAVLCSILSGETVRRAAAPGVEVIVDDQALERGGIELLRELLARPVGGA